MIKPGDFVKIDDIGPLAKVLKTGRNEVYLSLDGTEFWCPIHIISGNQEVAKMADRSNVRLNEAIEQHIAQWDGTVHGYCIKNMWENGADYESICEAANIDIEEYEDD